MKKKWLSHRLSGLLTLGVAWLLGSLAGCGSREAKNNASEDPARYFDAGWARNATWDDGLAEVATYAAERVIYGKNRTFDYVLITVKEDFNKAYNVKTNDYKRQDLFPVIKVNQFCRIPTDNYPYHFLTSLFFRREDPVQLYKLTSSSQEWCGNTFKAINLAGNRYRYSFNSYWDGQGENEINLGNKILFEDQLPYTLRSLAFRQGLTFPARVAELLQTNKANYPVIYPATFRVSTDQLAGKPMWRVQLQLGPGKTNTYWFAQAYPHVLERQQTWDGRSLQLKSVKRYAYWEHQALPDSLKSKN